MTGLDMARHPVPRHRSIQRRGSKQREFLDKPLERRKWKGRRWEDEFTIGREFLLLLVLVSISIQVFWLQIWRELIHDIRYFG